MNNNYVNVPSLHSETDMLQMAVEGCVLRMNDYYRRLVDPDDSVNQIRKLISVMGTRLSQYDSILEAYGEQDISEGIGYHSEGGNSARLSLPDMRQGRECSCCGCSTKNSSVLEVFRE